MRRGRAVYKGDFVTGFPPPRSAVRFAQGHCKPHNDLVPCAYSFAIKTGSPEKQTDREPPESRHDFMGNISLDKQRPGGFKGALMTIPEQARRGILPGAEGTPGCPSASGQKPPPGPEVRRGSLRSGLFQPMELLNSPIVTGETNGQRATREPARFHVKYKLR